jgi:hypothetical protein
MSTRIIVLLSFWFNAEVVDRIPVADILNGAAYQFKIGRKFTVFDVVAKEITHYTAEIFMSRVGEKTARVGEHTNESGDKTHVGEGVQLSFHTILLIIKPPAGAELHFPGGSASLKIADCGSDHFIVTGVEDVEDGLG